MKQKHMLSLLQKGFTTVNVMFPASQHKQDVPQVSIRTAAMPWEAPVTVNAPKPVEDKLYVYKTSDTKLKEGDRVIVERNNTPSGLAIGIVHSVDLAPKIDVDADFDYKWIIQRVDMADYEAKLQAEAQFNAQIQEVEREHQREQLMQKMTEHLPQGSQARALFDNAVAMFGTTFGVQAAIAMQPAAAPTAQPQAAPVDVAPGMACK